MKSSRKGLAVEEKNVNGCERILYALTESSLVIWGLPTLILIALMITTNIIILIDQDNYDKCIESKKVAKVAAGGNSDDISDMLKWHLRGSVIWWYVYILVYAQIIFSTIKCLYKYSGLFLLIVQTSIIGYNVASIIWLTDNDWDDTRYYYLAIANNVLLTLLPILSIFIIIIVSWWGACSSSNDKINAESSVKVNGRKTDTPGSKDSLKKTEENMKKKEGKFWEKLILH